MQRLAILLLLAACSAPSIDPGEFERSLPAGRELAPAAQEAAKDKAARALVAAEAGRRGEAQQLAEDALAVDPRQGRAHAALGLLAMARAQAESPPTLRLWRAAEGHLRRGAVATPADAEVQLALARFFAADGHGRAALDVLDRLLLREPEQVAALRLAGVLAYEAAEERRARSYLTRLLAREPDNAVALYRLAHCEATIAARGTDAQARAAGYERAATVFSACRDLVPDDIEAILGEAAARIAAHEQIGKSDDPVQLRRALALYQQAAALARARPEPSHGEGVVRELLGEPAAAAAAYERALDVQPNFVPSLLNLAALCAEGGDQPAAKALWARARKLEVTPSEANAIDKLLADG